MKFLRKFNEHTSYEAEVNVGGIDFKIPNVSYCKDVKDVHFNPYNLIKFYVGNITGTTPQTVKIYTDSSTFIDVTVSKGNKWYSYLLPKDKRLSKIESGYYNDENNEWYDGIVTKAVVKADINTNGYTIIPTSTVQASFKGSNTSNVLNMSSMFSGCRGLISLDVSGWNTSNVNGMSSMFSDCSGLTSLDLSSFNTSNVTNMNSMFNYCPNLTSLDLRSFNTSNVNDMQYMFRGCSGLKSLDVSGWDISHGINMEGMFQDCSSLNTLDLSKWDTSKVTTMSDMFKGCSKLNTITMKGCSQTTIDKIKAQLTTDGIIGNITTFITE